MDVWPVRFLSLSFVPLVHSSLYSMNRRASTRAIVWTDRCIDTRTRMKEIAFDRIAPSACLASAYKNVKDG